MALVGDVEKVERKETGSTKDHADIVHSNPALAVTEVELIG
jgi:hypothetical protein